MTNSGQIRSSAVSTFSRTRRRDQSARAVAAQAGGEIEPGVLRAARFDRREARAAFDRTAVFDRHGGTPG